MVEITAKKTERQELIVSFDPQARVLLDRVARALENIERSLGTITL